MKEFNVTGLCIPEKHYMVDISSKIRRIIEMVDKGAYFTVNRPRQFGKTTTFNELAEKLNKKYIVVDASFEGIGDDIFEMEEKFCKIVFEIFAKSVKFTNKDLYEKLKSYTSTTQNFNDLSKNITKMIEEYNKDMILIIDEVDKSSGFSFVEPQTRQNKRMDVVITYGHEKHIVELKIWNGEAYRIKGMDQLTQYIKEQGLKEGYLLTFNFNKSKQYSAQWTDVNDKKIFEVMV